MFACLDLTFFISVGDFFKNIASISLHRLNKNAWHISEPPVSKSELKIVEILKKQQQTEQICQMLGPKSFFHRHFLVALNRCGSSITMLWELSDTVESWICLLP
jgi:hypothetical protein